MNFNAYPLLAKLQHANVKITNLALDIYCKLPSLGKNKGVDTTKTIKCKLNTDAMTPGQATISKLKKKYIDEIASLEPLFKGDYRQTRQDSKAQFFHSQTPPEHPEGKSNDPSSIYHEHK